MMERAIETNMTRRVVILSTADFDSALWTNKQHLAVGLSEAFDVTYIESMGLRQPSLSVADAKRLGKKLVRFVRGRLSADSSPNGDHTHVSIVSPRVLPFHKNRLVRAINRSLLHRQLKPVLADSRDATLWTFSPLTYGLEDYFGKTVYHSVDLLHTLPRVPGAVLQRAEIDLVNKTDHIIASSTGVEKHLKTIGATDIRLWENVAHVEVFTAAANNVRKDRAVFAGNLTPSKIDLLCLQSILDQGIELAIAGPVDIDGAGASVEMMTLLKHPLVKTYGTLPLVELANLLGSSKVGIIPYKVNEYTQGVFPMKVYEYLGSGLSVVTTPIPSLCEKTIVNVVAVKNNDFAKTVKTALQNYTEDVAAQSMETAKSHSWSARVAQAAELIENQKA